MNNKIIITSASVFLILASVYVALMSINAYKTNQYIGITGEQKRSLFMTGEGKVVGTPDVALIQLGYSIEKPTVAAAQKDNTEKMNAMIKILKDDYKIDSADIKTNAYNITSSYDWNNGKQLLRGYQVNQNIELKVRKIDQASDIIAAAGKLGLNQVGSLNFSIDNPEKLKQEARTKAITQAKEKAAMLSETAGIKLGRIISFSETNSNSEPRPMYYGVGGGMMDKAAAVAPAPSIEAGSNEVIIDVSLEYEIL